MERDDGPVVQPTAANKVDKIYAIIGTNPETGHEGIPMVPTEVGLVPLVTNNPNVMGQFKEIAAQIARQQKTVLTLAEFTNRKNIETIGNLIEM